LREITKKWAINAIINLSKINEITVEEIEEAINSEEE